MFEAVGLHKQVSKQEYEEALPELRLALLRAQDAQRQSRRSVIVIISGVEAAGKSEVVNRLNEWLDARWIRNHAFWSETDDERLRPAEWRYWNAMPARGTTSVMFGSWYTHPIIAHALGQSSQAELDSRMARIAEFERMLTADEHVIVKFWYHLTKKAQHARIKKKVGAYKLARQYAKSYEAFLDTSERAIRLTDTGHAPWHLIDAEDRRYRDLKTGKLLLQVLQKGLASRATPAPTTDEARVSAPLTGKTVLDTVPSDKTIEETEYRQRLKQAQERLYELGWKAHEERRSLVAVFEGWDAAGKGGAIRRVTRGLDARLYNVICTAAPTDEERARHYLWRFWRHIPRDGHVTLYDRSWYGRVLVERVEGFATQIEWNRAYQEINDFEEQLCRHGTVLAKFWLHISKEEQLRRFEERASTPHKHHKITEEDWRNRERWDAYAIAVTDMVARTSTSYAPWTLVPANDKRIARLQVVEHLVNCLEGALKATAESPPSSKE